MISKAIQEVTTSIDEFIMDNLVEAKKKPKKKPKLWMQAAASKMKEKGTIGSLHKALGVPPGQKIPPGKLAAAKRSQNPKIRKKANFAINARRAKH